MGSNNPFNGSLGDYLERRWSTRRRSSLPCAAHQSRCHRDIKFDVPIWDSCYQDLL